MSTSANDTIVDGTELCVCEEWRGWEKEENETRMERKRYAKKKRWKISTANKKSEINGTFASGKYKK